MNTRKRGHYFSILTVLSTFPQNFLDGKLSKIACHDWCFHAQKSAVMNEMLFAWMKKHMQVVGCASRLDEQLVAPLTSRRWCVLIRNLMGSEMEGSY
jgi:hypothetical protein